MVKRGEEKEDCKNKQRKSADQARTDQVSMIRTVREKKKLHDLKDAIYNCGGKTSDGERKVIS